MKALLFLIVCLTMYQSYSGANETHKVSSKGLRTKNYDKDLEAERRHYQKSKKNKKSLLKITNKRKIPYDTNPTRGHAHFNAKQS